MEAAAVREWLTRPAKQILTAGGSNEKAKEDRERGHSLFTFKLLEELTARAANPDRVFAMLEVAARLKTSVFGLSGGQQSPVFSQVDGTEGEFIFLPTTPQSVPAEGAAGARPGRGRPRR